MQPVERNPRFSNPLTHSLSPYLRQHAHNPVYWYPWGEEALKRARDENKPILLSIGYSTCYWCHVMEREVFENLSIASLMNQHFINIKVDREEHPWLDEIYMVARQLITQEGGWPNNVFLTPDLKPFYAGGTFGPNEAYGKPSFPQLLEWLNYSWTTQPETVRKSAEQAVAAMEPHLVHRPPKEVQPADFGAIANDLFKQMDQYHDESSGGFFQAPKFPHECYLNFLLGYHEATGNARALAMVTKTLGKMAAGGIYDHVACGFHRYAVDKEWYVPHFEKMLYNQALLTRAYTDAARITGNAYFADIAKSVLDFVSGPMTDGEGAFYAAIDAETDGVEGAYYAWSPEELQAVLGPEETAFFTTFFALADIPAFPGHKHVDGQVIVSRKPLDEAAIDANTPYVQLAAMAGAVMNKLLIARNKRKAPNLDDKIITAWNGLMIDAYAHAGQVLQMPRYIDIARRAADFILDRMIDNEGRLQRVFASGRAHIDATLEDYAYLIKGVLTLYRAQGDAAFLDAAKSLVDRADELFLADKGEGYFYTKQDDKMFVRVKSGDDSALPNPNAVMAENLLALHEFTKEPRYREKAETLLRFFIHSKVKVLIEFASLIAAGLKLDPNAAKAAAVFESKMPRAVLPPQAVDISAELVPKDAKPGDSCEAVVHLDIGKGWHINAARVGAPFLVPTQVDAHGVGVQVVDVSYPEPLQKGSAPILFLYEGKVAIRLKLKLAPGLKERQKIKLLVRVQPCHGTSCHKPVDTVLTL